VVFIDHVSDPVEKRGPHVVVFLLEVGQLCQAAVLYSFLVVVREVLVRDLAPIVVVTAIVEGRISAVISVEVSHVVSHDVHHHQDSPLVAGADEVDEVLFRAEAVVEFV
jgi:hypothetical protein